MDESATPVRKPRFPYVGALLCAACLGAAAWGWMRYSYAWDVTPHMLMEGSDFPSWAEGRPNGAFVALSGKVAGWTYNQKAVDCVAVEDRRPALPSYPHVVGVLPTDVASVPDEGNEWEVTGRFHWWGTGPITGGIGSYVDTTASRFTGASIAGLVVGAMGVFVFTVALRHWLRERGAVT